MGDLQSLYQSVIMDHNKHPRHYGLVDTYTHHAEGYNPICGDKIELQLELSDGRIRGIHFEAACCAICKASTSMMADALSGQDLKRIPELQGQVTGYLDGSLHPETDADALPDDLSALAGVSQFPARVKCAQLPWQTLGKALKSEGSDSN